MISVYYLFNLHYLYDQFHHILCTWLINLDFLLINLEFILINLDFFLNNLEIFLINLEKKSPGSDVQTQKVARSNPAIDKDHSFLAILLIVLVSGHLLVKDFDMPTAS